MEHGDRNEVPEPRTLADLGINEVDLIWAIEQGERSRRACTPFDPPSAPGFFAWAGTVRGLRERLIQRGWKPENPSGLPMTVKGDRTMAVVVATGDEATGTAYLPRTKKPRGPVSVRVIATNQLSLFGPTDGDDEPSAILPDLETVTETWFLLFHMDAQAGEIRAELSLPATTDDSGNILSWAERIPLAPIPLGIDVPLPDDNEPGPEYDVDVQPRDE